MLGFSPNLYGCKHCSSFLPWSLTPSEIPPWMGWDGDGVRGGVVVRKELERDAKA